ncbi:MAG: class I SAM-dependent methyltransferase [Candidatus Kapabacteria bacterium]|nr:class I SAM-dependent methyltransferase [Candidatus Kapabacteria bacterium]
MAIVQSEENGYYGRIASSKEFAENERYYWGYQYLLARDVIVPELMQRGAFKAGDAVAEIGCGEAGVLDAFVERGAVHGLGTDIAPYRLSIARKVADTLGIDITVSEHDILFSEPLPEWRNRYQLAILRDVIEHLDDATLALKNIRNILAPGGWLYVTFPPYNSPYGGHQHLLHNSWGKIPYMHLLPEPLFKPMISTSTSAIDIEEVQRLRNIRLSASKFMQAARDAGYSIEHEEYYLFRPVFKLKFGLPTIRLTALKSLPLVKSVFSLEAAYLLRMT